MTLFLPMLLHQLLSSQFFSSLSERACFHSIQDTNFQLLNIKNKAKKMLKMWKKNCRFSYLSTKLGDLSAAALFARAEAITSPPVSVEDVGEWISPLYSVTFYLQLGWLSNEALLQLTFCAPLYFVYLPDRLIRSPGGADLAKAYFELR